MNTVAPQRPSSTERAKSALHGALTAQRAHVIGILEGGDEQALRRPVGPFDWSCLGLVQHLTLDVERFWFRGVVAGELSVTDGEPGSSSWALAPDATADGVFAAYRKEIALADAVIATTSVETAPGWWPQDVWGDWRLADLGAVLLHAITETACHASHLDAARETIDGRRWMVV